MLSPDTKRRLCPLDDVGFASSTAYDNGVSVRYIGRQTPTSAVLGQPGAFEAIREIAPDALASPMVHDLADFPFGPLMTLILGADDRRVEAMVSAASAFEDPSPAPPADPPIVPGADYESESVVRASAEVETPDNAFVNRRAEITFRGPSHGNPFTDVELSATFRADDTTVKIGGFYDGEGVYRLRFLPPHEATWQFETTSNARSLDGIQGAIIVGGSAERGPTHVAEQFHFKYADGTPYLPLGTTSYAWTHQPEELQEETLRSLERAPFNKIRMALFPKSMIYNANEPERFLFERHADGSWDTTRFDLEYFAHLEHRLDQLDKLGIVADIILFHPYDRWGFAALGATADDRYLTYVARRLSAFSNIWWSMANEYDLLTAKRAEDWDRLAGIVQANDPVGHPLSIHNWVEVFDYSADWATHASIQRGDFKIGESISKWRRQWGKPVVVDEFGYEGDIDQGWGNVTAEEVVRMFWHGTMHGGYLTHGETYWNPEEVIWWSKGGTFRGESQERLAFLAQIVAASPSGRLEPLPSEWDAPWAGVPGEYLVGYYGDRRPIFRTVRLPEGMSARIEIIDTWNMEVTEVPGTHKGEVRIDLPARQYIAVRITPAD